MRIEIDKKRGEARLVLPIEYVDGDGQAAEKAPQADGHQDNTQDDIRTGTEAMTGEDDDYIELERLDDVKGPLQRDKAQDEGFIPTRVSEKRKYAPKTNHRWTPYEDRRLISLKEKGYPPESIARDLGRQRAAVTYRARKLGYPFKTRWTKDEDQLLIDMNRQRLNKGTYSLDDIAKQLNRSKDAVITRLNYIFAPGDRRKRQG